MSAALDVSSEALVFDRRLVKPREESRAGLLRRLFEMPTSADKMSAFLLGERSGAAVALDIHMRKDPIPNPYPACYLQTFLLYHYYDHKITLFFVGGFGRILFLNLLRPGPGKECWKK